MLRIQRSLRVDPLTRRAKRIGKVKLLITDPISGMFFTARLKIDTGCDFVVVPISMSAYLGHSEAEIRRRGKKVQASLADGGLVSGFLHSVTIEFSDDFGGWARWDAEICFVSTSKQVLLAGHH